MEARRLDVCIIDEKNRSRETLRELFSAAGYAVREFSGARDFYASMLVRNCDVVIFDMGLPHDESLSIAATLRQLQPPVGIIMTTEVDCVEHRLKGLRVGADACLVVPVDEREVLAVTANLLGRLRMRGGEPTPLPAAATTIGNPTSWSLSDEGWTLVCPGGEGVHLTVQERLFMQRILQTPGDAVSREELVNALGGDPYDYDLHRIEALVSRLRRKMKDAGFTLPLRSVRGKGYLFLA